jgi:Holliday junction resolvasome RuvABC ATP-dependent DNA helicase subunit
MKGISRLFSSVKRLLSQEHSSTTFSGAKIKPMYHPTRDGRNSIHKEGLALTQQEEIVFWFKSAPTREERNWWINRKNPECPFSQFVGNDRAVRRLSRVAWQAMGRANHCCSEYAFALCGPASTGKTTLAKMFARLLKLPFVEIEAESLVRLEGKSTGNQRPLGLLDKIREEIDNTDINGLTLSLAEQANGNYILPPMIVFIDEVHNLKKHIVQGLLKPVEGSDCRLVTEMGTVVDTSNVCWIVATTEWGDLFGPFKTRFDKLQMRLYSKKEIAKIVRIKTNWEKEICELVAHYCGFVPREAERFANEMRAEYSMNPGPWEKIAEVVAEDRGIDSYGMSYQRLSVLKTLAFGPATIQQLMLSAQTEESELRRDVLPPLLASTENQPDPLVQIGARYAITKAGLAELDKREIENGGIEAIPKRNR